MRKYFDRITRVAGNVVTVQATGVGYNELAVVTTERTSSLAQVIHLAGDQVSLQVFAGTQGVSTGDRGHVCYVTKVFALGLTWSPQKRAI